MNYYSQIKWVNEYAENLKPYIFVRDQDNLIIKIPNEAYKANVQGITILKKLLDGKCIYSIIDKYKSKEKAAKDIHFFFCDLKALFNGCYNERESRYGIEKTPFNIGYTQLPVLSELAITYRCNLKCKFCYASCNCRKKDNSKYDELHLNDIKKIIYIIKNEALVPSISFTGGEPLLRTDIFECIEYAKSLNMWTNLISNGTLIDKKTAIKLKSCGLNSAQISIEGGNDKLHDAIVQKNGAFVKCIQGIKNLKEAGVRVHTNTTISTLNMADLFSIIDTLKNLEMDKFSMNLIMPAGSALLDDKEDLMIKYTKIGDIVLKVKDYAELHDIEFMWYSPTPVCIFNPIIHSLGNKGCAACDGLLSISPKGDILPCSSYPKPLGNILENKGNFEKLWKSSEFLYFKNKEFAHDKCKSCDSLSFCNGGCPLYWDQFGYSELLNFKNRNNAYA